MRLLEWLNQMGPGQVIGFVFAAGVVASRLHAANNSLRRQGERIGQNTADIRELQVLMRIQRLTGDGKPLPLDRENGSR